jgi:hypothetical protein
MRQRWQKNYKGFLVSLLVGLTALIIILIGGIAFVNGAISAWIFNVILTFCIVSIIVGSTWNLLKIIKNNRQ